MENRKSIIDQRLYEIEMAYEFYKEQCGNSMWNDDQVIELQKEEEALMKELQVNGWGE